MQIPRGISSAGRAPALQAGGRRFDPVILHQTTLVVKNHSAARCYNHWLTNTKAVLQRLLLYWSIRSIGCSLKIHRVEISIADGKHFKCTVPSAIIWLRQHEFNFLNSCNDEYSQSCVERHSQRYSHYGITREVWDLTSLWTRNMAISGNRDQSYRVKWLRAYGGCLGDYRRWKTW